MVSFRFRTPRPQLVALAAVAALLLAGACTHYGVPRGTLHTYVVHSVRHAQRAYIFPSGGRTLLPDYRIVALYGAPDTPALGALGEQPLDASIARAKSLAAQYRPLMTEHTLPALEIIATVASSTPADNGTYSYAVDTNKLQAWITAARKNGVYVVLDLQPGRSDFLTQARRLEPLLEQPNVGLALDPEWRLKPAEIPLQQIGSVDITEVNQTAVWLADLVRQNRLPQKAFILHEFMLSMLPGRMQLDTAHQELAYIIQMDGQGTQAAKLDTWNAVTSDPPANVSFGWKNFYMKDAPMRSPAETMGLTPAPRYISYQ